MMDQSKLFDNIRSSLKTKGIELTERDIATLYASTMSGMYTLLDEGKTVDISDFGSFWRKGVGSESVTFFKPIERLLERINTRKK